jgi:hypothetical protein
MEQVVFAKKNTRLLKLMYAEFENRYENEQVLLSELSIEIYNDAILYLNLKEFHKAQTCLYALASWISRDVQYFMKMNKKKQRMYEYDLVLSIKLLDQLIDLCEDFQQWDVATIIKNEYSKLTIRYTLMREAA